MSTGKASAAERVRRHEKPLVGSTEETGLPTDDGDDHSRSTVCIDVCSQSYSIERWRSLELLFNADNALHSHDDFVRGRAIVAVFRTWLSQKRHEAGIRYLEWWLLQSFNSNKKLSRMSCYLAVVQHSSGSHFEIPVQEPPFKITAFTYSHSRWLPATSEPVSLL